MDIKLSLGLLDKLQKYFFFLIHLAAEKVSFV